MRRHTLRSLLLASTVMFAVQAHAEEAPDARPLSEVVVTAQRSDLQASSGAKSATPLVETPQAISVVDRADLDLRVVQNLNEAIHFTAGMGPDTRGNTARRYDQQTLRGFTPDQYLDGLRIIQSANGYAVPQIDVAFLERIEVVKGPASVLYGSASPGGIVALSSKLPTPARFGELTLSGGSFATARASLDLGGPLNASGTLSYRLVAVGDRSDTETRLTGAERYGVMPAITWRPDERTSWTVLYNYQHDPKTGDYGAVPLQGSILPNPNGRIPRDFYSGEPDYERFDRTQNAVTSLFTRELGLGDWVFRQNTRFMRTSTVYRSAYLTGAFEPGLRLLDRSVAVADETVDAITLDNQLSGTLNTGPVTHNIIVGLDYQNTRQTEAAGFGGSVAPLDAFAPAYGSPVTPPAVSFDVSLRLQQTGVYAQDQIALGGWRLMLSGRNDWVNSNQVDRLGGGLTRFDQHKFTGRAGLLYLFDNGIAPYVSYATSFQPQTATDRFGNILPPTLGKQTEIGLKYQPPGWNALFTAAAFDLSQTNVATQDPTAPIGFDIAAGEVRSRGVELEGAAQPIAALRLKASYTYLDNVTVKDNSGLQGARPYGVPQATANAYAVYTFQSGPLDGLGLGGAVRYLGRSFNGVAGAGQLTAPTATLFDLLVSYDLGKLSPRTQGLTFNLDATNLFDKRYVSSCYSTIWCWYGAGRDVEASLRYRW
jgi:iron complex outermembrane receptor protein